MILDTVTVIRKIIYSAHLFNNTDSFSNTTTVCDSKILFWSISVSMSILLFQLFYTQFYHTCNPTVGLNSCTMSRVTYITHIIWTGNETLRCYDAFWVFRLSEALIESRQFIGWWRGCRPRRSYIAILILANAPYAPQISLLKKATCQQREELGSGCSVSFPTQRTWVM